MVPRRHQSNCQLEPRSAIEQGESRAWNRLRAARGSRRDATPLARSRRRRQLRQGGTGCTHRATRGSDDPRVACQEGAPVLLGMPPRSESIAMAQLPTNRWKTDYISANIAAKPRFFDSGGLLSDAVCTRERGPATPVSARCRSRDDTRTGAVATRRDRLHVRACRRPTHRSRRW
jgi:hypothetical protein